LLPAAPGARRVSSCLGGVPRPAPGPRSWSAHAVARGLDGRGGSMSAGPVLGRGPPVCAPLTVTTHPDRCPGAAGGTLRPRRWGAGGKGWPAPPPREGLWTAYPLPETVDMRLKYERPAPGTSLQGRRSSTRANEVQDA
jgi:hypothetical protein